MEGVTACNFRIVRADTAVASASGGPAIVPGRLAPHRKILAASRQWTRRQREGLVLYSSFYGRFSDNPLPLFESLRSRAPRAVHVWVASGSGGFPDSVPTVRFGSRAYHEALGQASHLVANTTLPHLAPRRRTLYLQTWHGTPYKRIGFENLNRIDDKDGLKGLARQYGSWTHLLSQNRHSTEVFRRAFRFEGPILETGYPRNDILLSPQAAALRATVRKELAIPEDCQAVLHAPTFRDDQQGTGGEYLLPNLLNLSAAADRTKNVIFLLRRHYWVTSDVTARPSPGNWRDVSSYPDIAPLFLAADALITDYSSSMFDFAVTRKPILFFVPDYEQYVNSVRGTYFDLVDHAPGPICRNIDELFECLESMSELAPSFADRYERFRQRFCYLDDGKATERVVALLPELLG